MSPAPARPLLCLHRLQKSLRQGLTCSFVGKHGEVQHSANIISVIKHFCDKAINVVLFNCSIGDWSRTTVGVRQGCLLSPTLFDIILERIMTDALEYHIIEDGLVQAIQTQYRNSSSAVLFNNQLGEFFKTTVGVRQEWLL